MVEVPEPHETFPPTQSKTSFSGSEAHFEPRVNDFIASFLLKWVYFRNSSLKNIQFSSSPQFSKFSLVYVFRALRTARTRKIFF